jgi:tetratricopeptide (TPR) repeat protein
VLSDESMTSSRSQCPVFQGFLSNVTDDMGSVPTSVFESAQVASEQLLVYVDGQIRSQKFEAAIVAAFRRLAQDEDDLLANYVLGKALLAKGDNDPLALQYLKRIETKISSSPQRLQAEYFEQLGRALTNTTRRAEGIAAYQSSLSRFRSDNRDLDAGRVSRSIALAYLKNGDPTRAKDTLLSQPNLENDVASMTLLTRLHSASGRHDEADDVLSRASRLRPGDSESRRELANANELLGLDFVGQKKYELALRRFQASLEFQDGSRVRYYAGVAAFLLGDYGESMMHYEKAVESPIGLTPSLYRAAWLNLLEVYVLAGRFDLLESRAEQALAKVQVDLRFRVISSYLRLIGRTLSESARSLGELKADEKYKFLAEIGQEWREMNQNWSTEPLLKAVRQNRVLSNEKKGFLIDLTRQVFSGSGA